MAISNEAADKRSARLSEADKTRIAYAGRSLLKLSFNYQANVTSLELGGKNMRVHTERRGFYK